MIPQAWQKFWQPTAKQQFMAGVDLALGNPPKLWDSRTVPLCRTGHGNVHYWLVWMMKNYIGGTPKIPLTEKYVRKEAEVARLAIERWIAAGGDIESLRANKLWGQI